MTWSETPDKFSHDMIQQAPNLSGPFNCLPQQDTTLDKPKNFIACMNNLVEYESHHKETHQGSNHTGHNKDSAQSKKKTWKFLSD